MRIEWMVSLHRPEVQIAIVLSDRGGSTPIEPDDLRAVARALSAIARTVESIRQQPTPAKLARLDREVEVGGRAS